MLYNVAQGRSLEMIALAAFLCTGGLGWVKPWAAANLTRHGLDVYANGDWQDAAQLASRRLKVAGNDKLALKLSAQASVRMGRDPSALVLRHNRELGLA
jgi:hypothetical protein